MNQYMTGKRVILRAVEENGIPEQHGEVIEQYENGWMMVCIDEKDREPNDADGLTEVSPDDVRPE